MYVNMATPLRLFARKTSRLEDKFCWDTRSQTEKIM